MRPQIHELLSLPDAPQTALQWHALLSTGLPVACLGALARRLEVTEKHLCELFNIPVVQLKRQALLSREHSNMLYRTAQALALATVANKGDVARAAEWLKSAQPVLKGVVPMLQLRSPIGTDYVAVAIARYAETQGIAV